MSGIMGMLLGAKTAIAAAVDEFFNRVTLLLPGDGTNGAQNNTFLDSSSNNFTITRNGNTTQGTFSPFSQTGWSNYFDGSSVLSNTTTTSTGFNLSTGSFTIEAWVYVTAITAYQYVVSLANTAGNDSGLVFGLDNTGKPYIGNGVVLGKSGSTAISANSWTHIAVVSDGTNIQFYTNGTANGSAQAFNPNTAQYFYVGRSAAGSNALTGYISNVRVTKGQQLYIGAFTPSTSALTTTSQGATATNVHLLTCQSNRFVDNGTNTFAITVTGTPSVQAFSPFAPTAAYSAATVGGSGYFDGSGDYLTGNGVLVTTTTANTFSCEGWFYPTTFANLIWLVGDMDATGGTNNVAVDISTGGAVELYWWDGAGKRCTSTTTMRLNQWNYFAIVVNAGAISIYVNSTTAGQSGTTTLTNRSASSQTFSVGAYLNSTTPNGYIGSLRWSTSARTISAIPVAPYTSDADTRLLLNFTNAGITDATAKNDLETVGNAQISTTQSKFGGSSMYFDGTGDYLKGAYSPNMILSGDFTIECWLNFSAHGNYAGIVSFANSNTSNPPTSGWAFNFYSTTDRLYFETGTGFSLQATNAVTANQWNHVAIVRSGSTITHYLNGTANGSGTSSATFAPLTTDNFVIGIERGLAGTITGYIDDLRITRYARYTANFTPPTAAFALQ